MSRLFAEEKRKNEQLKSQWKSLCTSNGNDKDIRDFFNSHRQAMIDMDGSPWFMRQLMENNHIKTAKYILHQVNRNEFTKSKSNPLYCACYYSTFEMVRFVTSNWSDFTEDDLCVYALICSANPKMSDEEVYLCAKYLLSFKGKTYSGNIINALTKKKNAIKLAQLMKSKIPDFGKEYKNYTLSHAIYYKNFEFAEYLIQIEECPGTLNPLLFYRLHGSYCKPDEMVVKWLLKKNVNINGFMQGSSKQTPLFRSCIDRDYDLMELLINNGADFHIKCMHENKEITAMQYCKQSFPKQYYEYFKNYNSKSGNTNKTNSFFLCGVDFSSIPHTTYQQKLSFDQDELLNELNQKYMNTKDEINDLQAKLNAKYNELTAVFSEQQKLMNQKKGIEKWNKVRSFWLQFTKAWEKWDVVCFVEYLKRLQYRQKSYKEYYSSDSECIQKIETYLKNNFGSNEFKGIILKAFDKLSINAIGITEESDVESVCLSLRELINKRMIDEESKQELKESKIEIENYSIEQ
eukprot:406257_1